MPISATGLALLRPWVPCTPTCPDALSQAAHVCPALQASHGGGPVRACARA